MESMSKKRQKYSLLDLNQLMNDQFFKKLQINP